MLRLVDITFHANKEYDDAESLVKAQWPSLIYLTYCKDVLDVTVIKHYTGKRGRLVGFGPFLFFKGYNYFGYCSPRTLKTLRQIRPDVVFVRGLIFPVQVIILRILLNRKTKILVRHHADTPAKGIKKWLQRLADYCIDIYCFTSKAQIMPWQEAGIIPKADKVVELPATLTTFEQHERKQSRERLGLPPGIIFLWVGRLHPNKDPLTVLRAFEKFLLLHPEASLHYIFQSTELLPALQTTVEKHPQLRSSVYLQGHKPNSELSWWYSAADFFISSSFAEGGSVAILEAMACGVVPIVTAIPASLKVIANGKYGLAFEAGNADHLYRQMVNALSLKNEAALSALKVYYQANYSAEAVTRRFIEVCRQVSGIEAE